MALRHQLWLVLPLSITDGDIPGEPVNSGMYGDGEDVRYGCDFNRSMQHLDSFWTAITAR